jgi:hypothetical protein
VEPGEAGLAPAQPVLDPSFRAFRAGQEVVTMKT